MKKKIFSHHFLFSLYFLWKFFGCFICGLNKGFYCIFLRKPVFFTDFHLTINEVLLVVRKWNTHENKGTGLYFQAMVAKKYLHTQAQPHTSQKARRFPLFSPIQCAFNKVCGCACVCKYFLKTMAWKYRPIPLFSWVYDFHTTYTSVLMSKWKCTIFLGANYQKPTFFPACVRI